MKKVMLLSLSLTLLSTSVSAGGRMETGSKSVTAYTTLDEELARDVFKAFEEEAGIRVDWVRLSTGEDGAFSYMQELDRNITQYTRPGSAPGKNASLGEVTVAIGYAHDGVKLVDMGYPPGDYFS